jgi:hypothetical protein
MEVMTRKGGKLHGMLEKQANSLRGSWEQMTDAFDLAKIKLGQIIIEETGLKDVVKDLESFGKGIEGGIDTRGLRDAIHFAGDLAKGVAHVGYEFAKAGVQSGDIFGQMARDVPVFKETFSSVQKMVDGMREFKIQPADIAEGAVAASKDILANAAALMITFAEVGSFIKTEIIDPIKQFIADLKVFKQEAKGFRLPNPYVPATKLPNISELQDFAGRMSRFDPQRELMRRLLPTTELTQEPIPQANFAPGAVRRDDAFDGLRAAGERLKKTFDAIDRSGNEIIYRLRARETDKLAVQRAAERLKQINEPIKQAESLRQIYYAWAQNGLGQFGTRPVDLMSSLPMAAYGLKVEQDKVNAFAALGGIPMGLARGGAMGGPAGLRFEDKPRASVLELAEKLNDQFDPLRANGKFMRMKAEMDEALKRGLISQSTYNLGYGDEVKQLAERLGIQSKPHLADAALVGSQEDARLLSHFFAGQQQVTTEQLLTQIRDDLARIASSNNKMAEAPAPRPVNVAAPGGG